MKTMSKRNQKRDVEPVGLGWLDAAVLLGAFVAVESVLPWWGIVVPALLGGLWLSSRKRSVGALAFIGAVSWLLIAALKDFESGGRLSYRIAAVMGVENPVLSYALTATLAALLAGLAAQCGVLIRKRINESRQANRL